MKDELDSARNNINAIDEKMSELFVKRMQEVEKISAYKQRHGLPIFDATREQQIIEKNSLFVEENLRPYYVDFLKSTMNCSRRYQQRLQKGMKIAYSGVEGAFACIATKRIFPDGIRMAYSDFASAYKAVIDGECDACVLPIENSFAGEVGQVVDLIFDGELSINGIFRLEIMQNLLGVKGAKKSDIKEVISHAQALAQSDDYIKRNGFIAQERTNTAVAGKEVASRNDKTIGAIASIETAEIYGLEVIERNVNQSNVNTTRFAVLSKAKANKENPSTILNFIVKHETGSLAKAINTISKHGFNMTALRSRPVKNHPWEYYFYVEIDGDVNSKDGLAMLKEMERVCEEIKVVGSYNPQMEI